jgi:hypothetical protein
MTERWEGRVRVCSSEVRAPLENSDSRVSDDDAGFAVRPLAPEATCFRTHVVPTRPSWQTEARNPGTRRDLSRRDAAAGSVSLIGRARNARGAARLAGGAECDGLLVC